MSTAQPIKALIIEDVEDDAALLVNALRRDGFDLVYKRVDNSDDLISALAEDWDIVFSDYTMPGFDGKDALDIVRYHHADLPFIFVSGTIGEDRAVEAVKSGAQDYIIKGHYKRLPVAVNHALKEARMKHEHRLAQQRIHELINVDMLTGTASRGFFLETLIASLEKAANSGDHVGIFFVNIDNFRNINDGIGIKGGDALISELANRLTNAVTGSDLVARLYADQFAVIVPRINDAGHLHGIVERLLECFETPFFIHRYHKKITGSLGYCLFPDDGKELQLLVNNATLAQSHAKRSKSNSSVRYTPEFRQQYEKRVFLEEELEKAIQRNEFILHYQPQIETLTGRILGAESLVRWNHPRDGFVSPLEFIPLAEESGLILPLGSEICRLACRQIAAWTMSDLLADTMRIAINISSQQFQQEGFADELRNIIGQFGVDPARIELEITETALMSNPDVAFSTMTELSNLGISIALDDFGTGYSSLSYLDHFPINVLKIDKSFTANLPRDTRKASIINAIIAMAEQLGVKVVAEGIENSEQLEFLRDAGCDMAQGYYIQVPTTAEDILPVLMAKQISR